MNIFQNCLRDIDASLNILEDNNINEKEVFKGQLIVKLLKRKIECLIALKQYEKVQIYWDNLLEISNNVYKISLEGKIYNDKSFMFYY